MSSRFPLVATCMLLVGCNKSPSDVREWKPSDHDHQDSPTELRQRPAKPPGHPTPRPSAVATGAIALWVQHCKLCHGTVGRGDGPQGEVLGAKDLSDPGWQDSTNDGQIAEVIRQGKGKMPGVALDPPSVQSLVQLVRRMRGDGPAATAGAGSAPRPEPTDAGSSD